MAAVRGQVQRGPADAVGGRERRAAPRERADAEAVAEVGVPVRGGPAAAAPAPREGNILHAMMLHVFAENLDDGIGVLVQVP